MGPRSSRWHEGHAISGHDDMVESIDLVVDEDTFDEVDGKVQVLGDRTRGDSFGRYRYFDGGRKPLLAAQSVQDAE